MRRTSIVCVVCAAALGAPAASVAGGPIPGTDPAGGSLVSPGGSVRYDVRPGTDATTVAATRRSDGRVLWERSLSGVYGTAVTTARGAHGGLSADGSLLVLATFARSAGAAATTFALVPTAAKEPVRTLRLRGDWGFDALSPDARVLFLIQRIGRPDGLRYNVRAVDVRQLRLRDGVVAAKGVGAPGEQMAGIPVTRIADRQSRWLYTLYATAQGGAFIHALDTVTVRAVCLDLPWRGASSRVARLRMALSGDAGTLLVRSAGWREPVAKIDLATLQVFARPDL